MSEGGLLIMKPGTQPTYGTWLGLKRKRVYGHVNLMNLRPDSPYLLEHTLNLTLYIPTLLLIVVTPLSTLGALNLINSKKDRNLHNQQDELC